MIIDGLPISYLNSLPISYLDKLSISQDNLSIPSIEDLTCNKISVKSSCTGSLEIGTIPPGADIYIFEESIGDYALQSVKTGSVGFPTIINGIECTGPTRSNKFKLQLSGYEEVEGILIITSGETYPLYIIFDPAPLTELGGGFLIPAIAAGFLFFLLFGKKKKKHKKKHHFEEKDKEKEDEENDEYYKYYKD